MQFFRTIIPALPVCARVFLYLLMCVAIVFIQLRTWKFFVLTNEKSNKVDRNQTCNLRTAAQTSYPLSHYDSHQVCGEINCLKLYYFVAKPS